jgi:hypothetical protein
MKDECVQWLDMVVSQKVGVVEIQKDVSYEKNERLSQYLSQRKVAPEDSITCALDVGC